MSVTIRELTTIHAGIEHYLKSDPKVSTLLTQAYIAIAESNERSRRNLAEGNPVYSVLQKYIGFSHGSFTWLRKPIWLDRDDISSSSQTMYAAERHFSLLRPIYDVADTVISQEGKPIDKHDSEHIRRGLVHVNALISLMKTYGQEKLTYTDELVARSTIVQHDVALGLTGRKHVPHEVVGSILTPLILQADDENLQLLLKRVATNTHQHVTSNWDFAGVKLAEKSPAYAIAVMSDELEICNARASLECLARFKQGEVDPWFYLNYFTQQTTVEWDAVNACPMITLKTYVGNKHAQQQHEDHIFKRFRGKTILGQTDFKSFYGKTLVDLLFTQKKVNLFKSAFKAMFGTTSYTVQAVDCNDHIFFGVSI